MKLRQHVIGTLLFSTLICIALVGIWLLFPQGTSRSPISVSTTARIILLIGGSITLRMLANAGWIDLTVGTLLSIWPIVLLDVCVFDVPFNGADVMYTAYSIASRAWIPCALGLIFAWLPLRKWNSRKARLTMSIHALLPAALLIGGYFAVRYTVYTHMARASQELCEPALVANADELSTTKVAADLSDKISAGTNLLWCGTFQLAWNEMVDLIGKEIRCAAKEPLSVARLNLSTFDDSQIDPESYLALAGPHTAGFIQGVNKQLADKFGAGTFDQQEVPNVGDPLDFVSLAYLVANLPFEHAFERTTKGMDYRGTRVASFTLPFSDGLDEHKEKAMGQILLQYPPETNALIMELSTRKKDHHLILAKLPPEPTLATTVEKTLQYADTLPTKTIEHGQRLEVPLFNFDITREYHYLTNKQLSTGNAAFQYGFIKQAEQNIRFQLDERGAAIKSSANIKYFCAPAIDCVFDKPFLLMLRYKDSPMPYFAMWVDNAEILVEKK